MKIYNSINNLVAFFYIKSSQLIKKYIIRDLALKQNKQVKCDSYKNEKEVDTNLYQKIINIKGYEKEIQFIKEKEKLLTFPYEFINEYDYKKGEVWFDFSKKMFYVIHQNKRLYFPKKYVENSIVKKIYAQLRMEADLRSPHSYIDQGFSIGKNSILFDVGAAEGIFTLSNIDKIKCGYLFEGDSNWTEPLLATFEPYMDKIKIVDKFVSDEQNENCVKLDSFVDDNICDEEIFVKIDVEGMEEKVLNGAKELLGNHQVKCACCTYHRQDDYSTIREFFEERNYLLKDSNGVMLFTDSEQKPPYFRKGVIRATKLK